MNLIYYPNAFLNQKLDPVDLTDLDFNPHELKQQMTELMLEHNGIGLSASQVGINKQLFVMGNSSTNTCLCINPQILQITKDTVIDIEGCLSFPNIFVQVKRPKEVLVEYTDENLEQRRQHLKDYSGKCFLHEYDHLQGITFKDRVSTLKWKMAVKKSTKKR
tara:strand:+ start:3586 stop:4071 length:486 start_codon:yes stop_codon:yes gene_type:complete